MVAEAPGDLHLRSLGRHGRVPRHVPRRRRAVAAGVLPSRVGMADEREGAGDLQRAEGRRADQRDVPQPAVCRERIPVRPEPEHRRTGAGAQHPRRRRPTNLERPFASGTVEFLNIVKPGVLYGDRLNAVDLRFGKILKYGTTKTQVSLDVFNLFNSNTTEVYQRRHYGAGDVSQPAVDHVGAVLQDQRAVRLLRPQGRSRQRGRPFFFVWWSLLVGDRGDEIERVAPLPSTPADAANARLRRSAAGGCA